jgi:hypothetical protein
LNQGYFYQDSDGDEVEISDNESLQVCIEEMKAFDPINLNLKIKLQDKEDSFIKSPTQEKEKERAEN